MTVSRERITLMAKVRKFYKAYVVFPQIQDIECFRTRTWLGLDLEKSEPSQVKSLVRNVLDLDPGLDFHENPILQFSRIWFSWNTKPSEISKGYRRETQCEWLLTRFGLAHGFKSHVCLLLSTPVTSRFFVIFLILQIPKTMTFSMCSRLFYSKHAKHQIYWKSALDFTRLHYCQWECLEVAAQSVLLSHDSFITVIMV